MRVFDLIESVKNKKVLFVGDTIIDEYVYVTPLGKSPKENLIPVQFKESEGFYGGVDAAAAHLKTFCADVQISSAGPATRKTRMVDAVYFRKLFEIHRIDGVGDRAWKRPAEFDCTVVTDFGHGAIRATEAFEGAKFLAVNAQTNSANVGFNLITKYPKADYIVIDEPEARLAAADRDSKIEEVILKLTRGRCRKMIVTLGSRGAIGFHEEHGFSRLAAFGEKPVDTMGAGDAFFAVTAPMAKDGSIEELLLIGNAAATLKTQIIGHRNAVTKEALIGFLKSH